MRANQDNFIDIKVELWERIILPQSFNVEDLKEKSRSEILNAIDGQEVSRNWLLETAEDKKLELYSKGQLIKTIDCEL